LASKNIKSLFLPAYTPELNPTELCFNFIRHYVKKNKPRTYEELKSAIDKIIGMLNEKDLTEYFRHCSEYEWANKSSVGVESGNLIRTL
jgi:transposase